MASHWLLASLQRRAMMASAPLTVQCVPACLSLCPTIVPRLSPFRALVSPGQHLLRRRVPFPGTPTARSLLRGSTTAAQRPDGLGGLLPREGLEEPPFSPLVPEGTSPAVPPAAGRAWKRPFFPLAPGGGPRGGRRPRRGGPRRSPRSPR